MASFTIASLTDHTGAEVIGLDFARPIDGETRATLNRAFIDHHVLVMRDQHFSPEQFKAARGADVIAEGIAMASRFEPMAGCGAGSGPRPYIVRRAEITMTTRKTGVAKGGYYGCRRQEVA